MRFLFCCLAAIIPGLPLNEPLMALLFLLASLAILTGTPRTGKKPLLIALGLVTVAGLLHMGFPRTRLPEGHNLFIVTKKDEPLSRSLPAPVYAHMAEAFTQAYPPEKSCSPKTYGCWRSQGVPSTAYAFSADSLWRGSPLSRPVGSVNVTRVEELGAGFINDKRYNWYNADSEIKRENPPWFVSYIWPRELVGSALCWRGRALWPNAAGTYDPLDHPDKECRTVTDSDIGHQVFLYSFKADAPLQVHLAKSAGAKAADFLYDALRLVLLALLVAATTALNPRRLLFPLLGMAGMIALVALKAPDLLWHTPVFPGGDDGLTHQGYARTMLENLRAGNIQGFLMGSESVFYMMPGLRYFLAGSAFLFGERVYLPVLALALFPLALGWVLGLLTTPKTGRVTALLFVAIGFLPVLPGLGVSFFSALGFYAGIHVYWTALGFPDVPGYLFFLVGLGSLLVGLKREDRAPFGTGGFTLALAVFLRPNLAPAAGLLILGVLFLLARRKQWDRAAVLCAAFSPLLLVPLHNILFGHAFVLLTSAATISANLLTPPETWFAAIKTAFGLADDRASLSRVADHLRQWLSLPSTFRGLVPGVERLALLAGVGAALAMASTGARLTALAALGLQLPLFFYNPMGRYVLLAWLLALLATIAVAYERTDGFQRRPAFLTRKKPAPNLPPPGP